MTSKLSGPVTTNPALFAAAMSMPTALGAGLETAAATVLVAVPEPIIFPTSQLPSHPSSKPRRNHQIQHQKAAMFASSRERRGE
jgi:hypothetical protein